MQPFVPIARIGAAPPPEVLRPAARLDAPWRDAATGGRRKLWDLPANYFCSVVGTCFPPSELRRIVARATGASAEALAPLAIHEHGVTLAQTRDEWGRVMQKTLERLHAPAVRRFDALRTTDALAAAWEEAKRHGDIGGAYWAVLTHRAAPPALMHAAFGDVHMLSHLVGAQNRADLRRVDALETALAEMRARHDRLAAELREVRADRDDAHRMMGKMLLDAAQGPARPAGDTTTGDVARLTGEAATLGRRLDTELARRKAAERRVEEARTALADALARERHETSRTQAIERELAAAERQLAHRFAPVDRAMSLRERLAGRTVLYVGGRAAQIEAIRGLVASVDADFLHHDGGLEERKGLVVGLIARADLVVFPVDCISHDAMGTVKRACRDTGRTMLPLRTSSVAAFLAGLAGETGAARATTEDHGPPPSAFCVRHG